MEHKGGTKVKGHLGRKWWARCLAYLILMIALLSPLPASPVQAASIGISGTFSGQHFQLIPGESLSTPDIYVVVFNNAESEIMVKLTPETPSGVELILPAVDFTLSSGSQQRIEIGVAVSHEAVPGEYILTLTAEASPNEGGIKLGAAAQQQAKLTIFGEAGSLVLSTVTPQGEPFPAAIKLYRKVEGQSLPCGLSETGKLETRLPPGDYLAEAYFQGTKVAEESLSLAADEKKDITLVARTIFLEGFCVVPNYHINTGELAFAKIVYTINNLYQPLEDVKAILKVTLDRQAMGEVELISLPILNVGKTAGSSNYIPTEGWQDGIYSFEIELYNHGRLYTQSSAQEMAADPAKEVIAESAEKVTTESAEGVSTAINWLIIGSIIGLILALLIIIFLRSRRLVR